MQRENTFRLACKVKRVCITTYAHAIFYFIYCVIEPAFLFDILFRVFCRVGLGSTIYCRPNASKRNLVASSACCQNLPEIGNFDWRFR